MHTQGTVERTAVRVVLLDARESVLLLHTRDLSDRNSDSAWELPGGGVEKGESFFAAVYREIQEETGLELDEARVPPPTWRRDVLYTYRGERRLQHESITLVRVADVAPGISLSRGIAFGSEDHFEHRWWAPQEIAASRELFFPRSLPMQLPRLLRGEEISEPLEVWQQT